MMPIWLELALLSLFAYAMGLGIGWLLWGRTAALPAEALPAAALPEHEGETAP